MAFAKHCVQTDTTRSGQGGNGSNGAAFPAEPAHSPPVNSPQGSNVDGDLAGEAHPGRGAKRRCTRMAWRREHRRKKDQRGTSALGSPELDHVVGGAGDQSAPAAPGPGPMPAPEMHPRVQMRCQPDIACHDQHQPARPADPGQVPAETGAIRGAVMPQDNAGKAPRQPFSCAARVGQAALVSEQPERWYPRPRPSRYGVGPDKKASVHGFSSLACATRTPVLTRPGPWTDRCMPSRRITRTA